MQYGQDSILGGLSIASPSMHVQPAWKSIDNRWLRLRPSHHLGDVGRLGRTRTGRSPRNHEVSGEGHDPSVRASRLWALLQLRTSELHLLEWQENTNATCHLSRALAGT